MNEDEIAVLMEVVRLAAAAAANAPSDPAERAHTRACAWDPFVCVPDVVWCDLAGLCG